MRPTMIAVLAFCLASSSVFAKPARSGVEPGMLETLSGPMDVVIQGQSVVVKVTRGAGDRWFRIETSNLTPLPSSFSADSAEIFYWQGHLLLLSPGDRKAVLFSMPGIVAGDVLAPAAEGLGPMRTATDFDALLGGYDVTRIDTAVEITSAQGPRARLVIERKTPETKAFTPPPNPSGGIGGCGSSCSTVCGDGSTCSVSCVTPRCASCSCPASCTCSF